VSVAPDLKREFDAFIAAVARAYEASPKDVRDAARLVAKPPNRRPGRKAKGDGAAVREIRRSVTETGRTKWAVALEVASRVTGDGYQTEESRARRLYRKVSEPRRLSLRRSALDFRFNEIVVALEDAEEAATREQNRRANGRIRISQRRT
jgi:hypothetical protein